MKDHRMERTPELVVLALEVSSIATNYEATIGQRPSLVDVPGMLADRLEAAGAGWLVKESRDFPDVLQVHVEHLLSAAGL